jgi:hypothetical protein
MIVRRIQLSGSPRSVRLGCSADSVGDGDNRAVGDTSSGVSPPNVDAQAGIPNSAAVAELSEEQHAGLVRSIESIFEAIAELEERRQNSIVELRELAVELACAITSHVIDDSLEHGQFPFERMIDQAITHLGVADPATVTIRLHPDDCKAIKDVWNEEAANNAPQRPILVPDSTLRRGSCEATVDSRGVVVDVDDQLRQIRHELLGTLNDVKAERRHAEKNDQHVQRYPDRRDTA